MSFERESEVKVPEDATEAEVEAAIEKAVDKEVDKMIDDELGGLGL
ncbi:hypothetical protein [Cellulosimicrobium cellulans]|nr:hypothetical protein [Cellulosimicrobium cellulans]